MDLKPLFDALGANILSNATIQAIVLITIADFVLGTLKAIQNKTFETKWLDAWVGDHLVKVIMILFGMVFGIVAPPIVLGDFSLNIVGAAAETAAAAYLVKTGASVISNFQFSTPDAPPESVA